MSAFPDYTDFFGAIWGYDPFPWQPMLAEEVCEEGWPRAIDLPTASGKTACIDIAVYALARQADRPAAERSATRRVWFVVDRRIVVDEAFARANEIALRLAEAKDGPLLVVADRLRRLAGMDRPLAVGRLRGGVLRDDRGWSRLPSQPAVITSTVDQVGSRLLFRAYGASQRVAPIYAGLAANDSTIMLDEAHCAVPFMQTMAWIDTYRGADWAEEPITTPFSVVVLSATLPKEIARGRIFPGTRKAEALDHIELQKRLESSKPARLVEIKTRKDQHRDPLVSAACDGALGYISEGHKRVAVMVNRVRTARDVVAELRNRVGGEVDVVLLTGRIRPFERDRLVDRWKPYLKANSPAEPARPIVLVSTQCLEVGADFSFDALVSETASLDALRQRFGRLARMGSADGPAPASILARSRDVAEGSIDPIYGSALSETWTLLNGLAAEERDGKRPVRVIDFGVNALDDVLAGIGDVAPYLAPAPDAPVLLPAHLDLLCQTEPTPHPEPDVQAFLHGKGRGSPEAQVIWRADLDPARTDNWVEIVSLCRPVSGEMLSVPLWRLRSWLKGSIEGDDSSDIAGAESELEAAGGIGNPFLLWRGREKSSVERDTARIGPGAVVVVPAKYGLGGLGQATTWGGFEEREPEGVGLDLWEAAVQASGRAAVRLTHALLESRSDCPPVKRLLDVVRSEEIDRDALDQAIEELLTYEPPDENTAASCPPSAWLDLLNKVRGGRLDAHPAGGVVLRARGVASKDEDLDLFADDDDLTSATGFRVRLDEHTRLVEKTAGRLAELCLPPALRETLSLAARWHDAGKLDERFQLYLRNGDELDLLRDASPLAKSGSLTLSRQRNDSIRAASGLPKSFRHEMLSVQLLEKTRSEEDDQYRDLLLHLVASHHGYGRPFAPVSIDDSPREIRGELDGISVELSAGERASLPPPHRIDSGVTERFWRAVARYGWWGLAYLEAMLRLADWYASGVKKNDEEDT